MSTIRQILFFSSNFWLTSTNVLSVSGILIFIVFVTIRVYKWKNSRLVQFASQLPGPTALPFIGNGLDFIGNGEALLQKFYEYESRYKSPYRIWFGSHLMVCISKPEDLEVIFGNSKLLGKPELFRCFQDFWGESIFSGPGTALDTEFDSESKMALDLHNCQKIALQICMEKMVKPWLHLKFISDFMYEKRVTEIRNRLLNLAKQAVKDKITEMKNYKQKPNERITNADKMELITSSKSFLSIAYELGQEAGNETLALDEILTMVTGGIDTVAVTMSFFLLMVSMHQDIQDKLYNELYEVFGDGDRDADTNDMKKLIYFEQVLKETLRRFPVAPIMLREVKEDTKIGEYIYPAGTGIIISTFAVHNNPAYYKNPLYFDPEHFTEDAVESRHKLTFLPFSAGPRNCIGQAYAMLELKLTLSTLLRRYKFNTTVKEKDIQLSMGFLLTSKLGYKVSITLRDRRPSYMKKGD